MPHTKNQDARSILEAMGKEAKEASRAIGRLTGMEKNRLLLDLADALEADSAQLLAANKQDVAQAKEAGLPESMLDRLLLTPERLAGIANDVRAVSRLADPVGEVLDGRTLASGVSLIRKRVPLGVVAVIYEARPNVTVDVSTLCLKTGNAVILRGGKETVHSNAALVQTIQRVLQQHGLPASVVQAITSPDRSLVTELLRLDAYVDMLIPRGGAGLHALCREQSRIPVITGGIGVCHIVVDASANVPASLQVVENAKVQRPSVCNAVETILVHQDIATAFLPQLATCLGKHGVIFHAGSRAFAMLAGNADASVQPVTADDYDDEWLTLDVNIEVVTDLAAAMQHIREHGTGHSEAILTENMDNAATFIREVDAAAVYVNASTRFTDGGEFGLGAEVAISTQKLHARGPLGLDALTTYKWIGQGTYSVRT